MNRLLPWRVLFFTVLAVVMVKALLPSDATPSIPHLDKLLHGLAFLTMFLLGCFAYPNAGQVQWKLLLGLAVYGVAIEVFQHFTGYRSCEFADFVADVAGLCVGLFFWKAFLVK